MNPESAKIRETEYCLVSGSTGDCRPDVGGWTLSFPDENPSLLRAQYKSKQLRVHGNVSSLYRFADWLPVRRVLKEAAAPIAYKSQSLARDLGLENLWISFSGWWPDKGAFISTGTFKECEALSVCSRMRLGFDKILVVASAGNTARAFARICSDNNIPLLLFVPEDNLEALWFSRKVEENVKILCPESGGDYFDAIRMSDILSASSRFTGEGGAKNIARRDGMGTAVLSAVVKAGVIPDVYFQAVGSGTGAIAAWEAACRLEEDGRFGSNKMRLIVSQNLPFVPMAESWKARSQKFLVPNDDEARKLTSRVKAKVLTNRRPPWSVKGGMFDVLSSSRGEVLSISNESLEEAGKRFWNLEGIDISPAASVAVASLYDAVKDGMVSKKETILLNITGGGISRFQESFSTELLKPSKILPLNLSDEGILAAAEGLF